MGKRAAVNGADSGQNSAPVAADNAADRSPIDPVEDFAAFLEQTLGNASEGVLSVWRPTVVSGRNTMAYVARVPAAEFSIESLRDSYGAGSYVLKLLDGSERYVKQFRIEIAPAVSAPSSPVEVAPAANNSELMNALKTAALAAIPALISRLLEPAKTDPVLLELIRSGGKSGGGVDPLELQRQITAAEERGYARAKELGDVLAAAGGDSIGPVLEKIVPPLVGAFQESVRNDREKNNRVERARAASRPATAKLPSPPAGNVTRLVPPWLKQISPYVKTLVGWANAGADPAAKAGEVVALVPDDMLEQIAAAAVANEDFAGYVLECAPVFAAPPVRAWFIAFFTAIQSMLTEDEVESEASDAAPVVEVPAVAAGGGE